MDVGGSHGHGDSSRDEDEDLDDDYVTVSYESVVYSELYLHVER